jgi:hypothetical protein
MDARALEECYPVGETYELQVYRNNPTSARYSPVYPLTSAGAILVPDARADRLAMFCKTVTRCQQAYNFKDRRVFTMETKPGSADTQGEPNPERDKFVRVITKLTGPIIRAAVLRGLERERERGIELPIQLFIEEVNAELLAKLYDTATADMKLNMILTGLMVYINKADKAL